MSLYQVKSKGGPGHVFNLGCHVSSALNMMSNDMRAPK